MATLRERPEARWAFWAGTAGLIAAGALQVKAIFASASATAGLGFIFVPLIAALAAAAAGIWGLALGHVVERARGAVAGPAVLLAAALAVAAAAPAAVGYEVWRGLRLERAVGEALHMDGAQLERAFAASPWREDRFFLGALAQNPAASAPLLDRIAAIEDPRLFEPLASLWDVLGGNRKGVAVMRLVAEHPNAGNATLERLARAADPEVARSARQALESRGRR